VLQAVVSQITMKSEGVEVTDIERFVPPNLFHFSIDLELTISLKGQGDALERFVIEVCTPSWVECDLKSADCINGSGKLLVRSYSYKAIRNFVDRYVDSCKGKTADDVIRRVGLLGDWESEWEL
jgi:Immunity protein 8